ncbi:MAG: hypothetical protein WBV82_17910 [Myxococcaceae bacterium]
MDLEHVEQLERDGGDVLDRRAARELEKERSALDVEADGLGNHRR